MAFWQVHPRLALDRQVSDRAILHQAPGNAPFHGCRKTNVLRLPDSRSTTARCDCCSCSLVTDWAPRCVLQRKGNVLFRALWQLLVGDENIIEEVCPHIDSRRRGTPDPAKHYFALERAEDNHSELNYAYQLPQH